MNQIFMIQLNISENTIMKTVNILEKLVAMLSPLWYIKSMKNNLALCIFSPSNIAPVQLSYIVPVRRKHS